MPFPNDLDMSEITFYGQQFHPSRYETVCRTHILGNEPFRIMGICRFIILMILEYSSMNPAILRHQPFFCLFVIIEKMYGNSFITDGSNLLVPARLYADKRYFCKYFAALQNS